MQRFCAHSLCLNGWRARFLVIVKQTPFTVLNARYRVRSFLFVYGGAFLLTLVPVLIEFGSQQDIVVYAPQRRTGQYAVLRSWFVTFCAKTTANSPRSLERCLAGTCNFSPTCLIVVVLDFYVLLALVTVGAVYLTVRRAAFESCMSAKSRPI